MNEAAWVPLRSVSTPDEDTFLFYHRRDMGALAARIRAPRVWYASWLDLFASARMVGSLMMVPETAMALSSALASFFLFEWEFHTLSVNLTWTTISFLLAFPLQNAITSAYNRRETAVAILASFRALLLNVMLANASWDWPGAEEYNGRTEALDLKKPGQKSLSNQHTERVHSVINRIVDALNDFLLVPRGGRPRHHCIRSGIAERHEIEEAELMGRKAIMALLQRLQGATEDLKGAGLPANEASRINQYNMQLVAAFERLWSLKTYRTPIGLRAIVRVFVQVLPFFYGPYWVHIARDQNKNVTPGRLAMSCLFSCAISLLLIAMMNVASQMENPFQVGSSDAVRVQRELDLIREGVENSLGDANSKWHEETTFEWEVLEVHDTIRGRH